MKLNFKYILKGIFIFSLYLSLSAIPNQLWSNPNLVSVPIIAATTIHQNLDTQPQTFNRVDLIQSFLSGWLVGWVGLFLILAVKGDLSSRE